MIETLTQNIEFILAFLATMSATAFIMVVVALIKKKTTVYTPFIAVGMGAIFGLLGGWLAIELVDSLQTTPMVVVTMFAGLVQGTLLGAGAVGIKVVADGEPDSEEFDWE